MDYAIIKVGNKQHRVRDGETLLVERGPKIIIGKYKRRTGYKRHNGFRAAISRVEITIGAGTKREAQKQQRKPKAEPVETPEAVEVVETAPAEEAASEAVEAAPETAEGVPEGYEAMTVAQIHAAVKEWSPEEHEAALDYERAHGARKGAMSALESALKKDEEASE